jgi:hypothetical protein
VVGARRIASARPVGIPETGLEDAHPLTLAWWADLWASPIAGIWESVDVPALRRLALLIDWVHQGDDRAVLLAEIRQLEDRFGLSPLARRRLAWELGRADAPANAPSRLYAAGLDVLVLSRLLGHSDVTITMRVYVHELPGAQMPDMDSLLQGGQKGGKPQPDTAVSSITDLAG